mmetsp:Transcript_14693/g.24114  ORF Transcript_14693/g.24114 Transcript_14693/m.24114 type:complete len:87 (+) Transcript_14693:121-381(+)
MRSEVPRNLVMQLLSGGGVKRYHDFRMLGVCNERNPLGLRLCLLRGRRRLKAASDAYEPLKLIPPPRGKLWTIERGSALPSKALLL